MTPLKIFPSLLQCPRYLSQADVHHYFEPWKNVGFTLKEKIQNMEDIWTILCLLCLASNEEFVFSESELELEHRHLTFWKDLTLQNLQPLGKMKPASSLQKAALFLCRKATHFCETQEERRDLSDDILLSFSFWYIILPSDCRRKGRASSLKDATAAGSILFLGVMFVL